MEWGNEAFEKAQKQDKPILLDLTAVWCHWCHVMDSTTYSEEEIAKIINCDFVPIKVYIDKRPDIKERYNMGGFPSTVFLNPKGYIIAGETYVLPEKFMLMLESVRDSYKKRKNEIENNVKEVAKKLGHFSKKNTNSEINENIVKEILISVGDNFDSFYGGFGTQPKFPSPEVIDLLFLQYKKTKTKKYLDMATKTLDGMYEGIFDKIDFGFFRYSVTQDWKLPHYEKMLDTNAGLLRNYAVAFNITKNEKFKKIAIETVWYIVKFLSDQHNGGFYGSQDADEEFYHKNAEERKRLPQPYVDKTIYADWNSMMISSFLKAGAILNDENAIKFALRTVDFILQNCYDKENGVFHYFDRKSNINGLLCDNVHFLNCLIDAYFATQNQEYLEKISEIVGFILNNFYDKKNYGFFDRILKKDDLGTLKHQDKQFLENSFCAVVFLRLYFITKNEKYKNAAENTILYFSDIYLNFSYFASICAVAVDTLLNGEIKVDILGKREMINACIAANNPSIVVNFYEKNDKKNPGYSVAGAYVCKGTMCKGPITDIEKLNEELAS